MSEKIYCGSARVIPTKFGDLTKVSFHKDDIKKMIEHIKSDGGDWINLVIKEKQNKIEGKPTHYLEVDTWKPNNSGVEDAQVVSAQPSGIEDFGDIPF